MTTRRAILGCGLALLPRTPSAGRCFQVGDLAKVIALPSEAFYTGSNQVLRFHAAVLQRCLGRTYQVIYVGDDGRPELDVTADTIEIHPCQSFSISLEPECVAFA